MRQVANLGNPIVPFAAKTVQGGMQNRISVDTNPARDALLINHHGTTAPRRKETGQQQKGRRLS